MSPAAQQGKDYIGVGVGAIIVQAGKVLLLKRCKPPEAGCWGIQGGALEFGETLEHAVHREVKEELGVEVVIERLLGVTDHILPDERVHWVAPVFEVKIVAGVPENLEPTKHAGLAWFDVSDLPDTLTLTTKNALKLRRETAYDRARLLPPPHSV